MSDRNERVSVVASSLIESGLERRSALAIASYIEDLERRCDAMIARFNRVHKRIEDERARR